MKTTTHTPVLLQESIEVLSIQKGDIVVDGTFGGGGHSSVIAQTYGKDIKLICVDLDERAKDRFAASAVSKLTDATFVHSNFKDADMICATAHVDRVNKVLLDLGTSTFQLLDDTRGFSFNSDTPLTMTFSEAGSHTGFTAHDIVNTWKEETIADIIFLYGEERFARKIAKAIVEARALAEIVTSKQLADIIEAKIKRQGRLHPATKTFQALRIAANDELQVIKDALENWLAHMSSGGRIAVITFHSLEDRIVKQWMLAHTKTFGRVITKKPIAPTEEELHTNPRSRSAKLRVFEIL